MIKFRIKGIGKLIRDLDKTSDDIIKNLNTAVRKSIFLLERNIKPITPVDTGRLQSSIGGGVFRGGAFPKGHGVEFGYLKGTIGTSVDYALAVHEGTKYWPLSMPPKMPGRVRQFMKVGLERSEKDIKKYFDEAIKKSL